MIYKFLVHKNPSQTVQVSFRDKWSLIPELWRPWWELEFRSRNIEAVAPVFVDVTEELNELNDVIEKLEWASLARSMDKHFVYPEVRCPWGCSEFLHRAQGLSLKDFLWYYSNYGLSYQTPEGRHWTDCISPSYPTPCLILEKFICNPSIAMMPDGPMILCCREHSASCKNLYLHIPESPTGTIYSPNCNSFAPVAIRSRTNRNFKPHIYSDTFCTVKQVGGFGGIDSSYVTSANVPTKCDNLSNKRDALSIQGRPDIKAQICNRCCDINDDCFMPEEKVVKLLSRSENEFPDPSILPECKTATYVPCETAVKLQELMFGEGSRTIRVYEDETTQLYTEKVFVPPWPSTFVHVHPMNGHGERILRVMSTDLGIWMLLCITGRVTDLWEALAESVVDNRSWQGHWLNFATFKLNFRGKRGKSRFFPLKSTNAMIQDHFPVPLTQALKNCNEMSDLFRSCSKIHVVDGAFDESEERLDDFTVVICTNPRRRGRHAELQGLFELRCLLSAKEDNQGNVSRREKWKMFVRHRGQQFWVQDGTKHTCKYRGETLRSREWESGQIAVYCRKRSSDCSTLQRRYLHAIGGQSSVYCSVHSHLLVLNHEHRRSTTDCRRCVMNDYVQNDAAECDQFGSYVCPKVGCKVSICDHHLSEATRCCTERSPDTVLYLSQTEATYGEYFRHDDGAIRGDANPEIVGFPAEVLGPTSPHELPQDTVDCHGPNDFTDDDSWESVARDVFSEESLDDSNTAGNSTQDWVAVESAGRVGADESIVTSDADSDSSLERGGIITDHFDTSGFPSTSTGVEQREILVEHFDTNGNKIPLSVFLNSQGHLLLRTSHKIRMNKLHRSICERIVAKNSSKVVPLVYAEAQLFPTTFWSSLEDGSILGAVPTALWVDKNTLRKFGIGSMREHAKMRITNPALPTSVDPAYHFMLLDQLANLGTVGKHTRVVLQRGFADHQHEDGISYREQSDSAEIFGETSENHANVHKLSALVRERRPHFFFTQTCNQKTCKGLRILREWITSTEALLRLRKKYGLDFNEAKRYLRESAASYVSRSWNEVADMWMRYIIYSREQPLGPVDYAWYRKEFQDTEGNLAHIHAILRILLDIDDPEALAKILDKIRGCVKELVRHDEYIKMKENGIVSSLDHLLQILAQAKSFLTHRCHTRCQIPKTTQDGETFFVCKVKENYYRTLTPNVHSIEPVKVQHLPEAKKIYNELGMMEGDRILEDCLVSEYHVPICSRDDPKFSPTNGHLFVCFPSSQNLQFTTGRALADYLVKYVTKMDDVARAEMKPPGHYDQTRAKAVIEQLHNTKITSNKILANKTRKKDSNYGRIVTHTECLSVVLGDEIVKSTVEFLYFSTSPREYRQAHFKQGRCGRLDVPDEVTFLANVNQNKRLGKGFPRCRLFSRDQMLVILDERSSSLSVDAITVFSVRPPELRFVNKVSLYFCWFERRSLEYKDGDETLGQNLSRRLKRDFSKCEWIDGLHMQVVLRRGAITKVLEYASECDATLFGGPRYKATTIALFRQIRRLHEQFKNLPARNRGSDADSELHSDGDNLPRTRGRTIESSRRQYDWVCESFLSHTRCTKLPILWTTPVFPKNRGRFLVHILLLFGRFETEYGLMNQPSMKDAFIHAGLFHACTPTESMKTLLTRYIRECLSAQSGSVQHHDRNLILAKAAFAECLLGVEDGIVLGTPCVLQSSMRHETTKAINEQKTKMLSSFISALFSDLERSGFKDANLPNKAEIEYMHCSATPLRNDGIDRQSVGIVEYNFPPDFDPSGSQSFPSYREQRKVLEVAKNAINRYMHGLSHKNIVICGGPGNGKTTVCEEACLYAFSKGLRGTATSIVADRSKALGGMHIHLLCAIPLSERRNMSPGRTAEAALGCIYRKPELLHFWRELQFLYIDEFGAVSAEMLATMDIIARKIKDSSRFLGGLLVICSMDIHQLLPIDGTALMLSMNMMCEFTFLELKESVRAARDANLRRLCNLTRESEWDDTKREEFRTIITQNCNFVASFDDPSIPKDGIFVFGRRAPCQKIEDMLVRRMENDPAIQLVISNAEDEESSLAGNWRKASPPVSQELSRKLKRKSTLYLFEKGRYEFTYNLHGHFQQGQLAILLAVDQDDVDKHRKLEFFKGPPGCKEFPSLEHFTVAYLQEHGWERVQVPFDSSKPTRVWGNIVGKRSQYGVRLRIASTIHASQGATFGKLVTAVSNIAAYGDLNFDLWEAAQVVVLLSRTRTCGDMYFVGDPSEVVDQLLKVLEMRSKYMAHITSVTQNLCYRGNDTPILSGPPIFRPCDIVLDKARAVYLLVSTKSYGYMYIGETKDIRKRLSDHNSGKGSLFTNNPRLRPWALFGYVTGFRTSDNRRLFEQFWKRQVILRRRRTSHSGTPTTVLGVAKDIVALKNRTRSQEHYLRVIQCGNYEVRENETFRIVDGTL